MIKGTIKTQTEYTNTLYTGLAEVTVAAINPTKSQLNKLLGREDSDQDKEIEYLGEDKEGNDRIKLSFWLHSAKLNKYFNYTLGITKKEAINKAGDKNQFINSVCDTSWADEKDNLPEYFCNFLEKNTNNVLAQKKVRKALQGEESLGLLLKYWLGKLNFYDPETEVEIDANKLLKEDYSELRTLLQSAYVTPFVVLVGVKTDENDSTKQYQQIFSKAFLPSSFLGYIQKGFKFPTDWSKKQWLKFEKTVTDPDYGFSSYYELELIKEYNREEDPSGIAVDTEPSSSKY